MGKQEIICKICPRECKVNRENTIGVCGMGSVPKVAKAFLHKWEEPCISGVNGSGTVFFSGCNLRCCFCQNYAISHENFGKEVSIQRLGQIYLELAKKGAHNINLVNPTHFLPQIKESITNVEGLKIPFVYNSNGYESIKGLKTVEGLIDVFLPDFKYYSPKISLRYSGVDDYFEVTAAAILEMYRQVGGPVFDENGLIARGLIIRHLILPGQAKESIKILDFIKSHFPQNIYISLMSQYTPFYNTEAYPEINRVITRREYDRVLSHFIKLGFENGYIQERESADEEYIPNFNLDGV